MIPTKGSGFQDVEHTADLALKVWADSEPELFRQAALGMISLMGVESGFGNHGNRKIDIRANDRESMLVQFLNQILLEIEVEGMSPIELAISIHKSILSADLVCLPLLRIKKLIKAATYSSLDIHKDGSVFTTTIVFDV